MDVDSPSISQDLSYLDLLDLDINDLANEGVDMPAACGLCGRNMSSEDEVQRDHQNVSLCDDCKFLLLEDFGSPASNRHRGRGGRIRSLNDSSGSSENVFSHQFSQIINLARHTETGPEDIHGDVDPNMRFLPPVSNRTTPNGSRRWRGLISDNESDGFNSDSFYGENESNISFGAYYHGDSDVTYSTYEGDSDASVDNQIYLNTDMLVHSVESIDLASESDIDPMHAGDVQWDIDDHQEMGNGEWEEVVIEQNAAGPTGLGARIEDNHPSRYSRTDSPGSGGLIRWRFSEVDIQVPSIGMDMEDISEAPYIGDPGNYLDAQGFEEFLRHLAETDLRRGAPPASTSFVNNLPLIVISKGHQVADGLVCAICKDLLTNGTEVNQLPCLHLYHPPCILPWLSARNSCPLCRYELPTDDGDYEQGKRNANRRIVITEIQQQHDRDDDSSVSTDAGVLDEAQEIGVTLVERGSAAGGSRSSYRRGGWLFLAAAPIVSLVGIVVVLWLGNPLAAGQVGQLNFGCQPSQQIPVSASCPRNPRERRWWWF